MNTLPIEIQNIIWNYKFQVDMCSIPKSKQWSLVHNEILYISKKKFLDEICGTYIYFVKRCKCILIGSTLSDPEEDRCFYYPIVVHTWTSDIYKYLDSKTIIDRLLD